MCGPADFEALHTSIVRLAGLSAAGLITYAVCKTVSLSREFRSRREEPAERALRNASGKVVREGLSGHPDA